MSTVDNVQSETGTTVTNVRLHLKAKRLPKLIIYKGALAQARWGFLVADENETEVSVLIGNLGI
jgi:hypothetical protein